MDNHAGADWSNCLSDKDIDEQLEKWKRQIGSGSKVRTMCGRTMHDIVNSPGAAVGLRTEVETYLETNKEAGAVVVIPTLYLRHWVVSFVSRSEIVVVDSAPSLISRRVIAELWNRIFPEVGRSFVYGTLGQQHRASNECGIFTLAGCLMFYNLLRSSTSADGALETLKSVLCPRGGSTTRRARLREWGLTVRAREETMENDWQAFLKETATAGWCDPIWLTALEHWRNRLSTVEYSGGGEAIPEAMQMKHVQNAVFRVVTIHNTEPPPGSEGAEIATVKNQGWKDRLVVWYVKCQDGNKIKLIRQIDQGKITETTEGFTIEGTCRRLDIRNRGDAARIETWGEQVWPPVAANTWVINAECLNTALPTIGAMTKVEVKNRLSVDMESATQVEDRAPTMQTTTMTATNPSGQIEQFCETEGDELLRQRRSSSGESRRQHLVRSGCWRDPGGVVARCSDAREITATVGKGSNGEEEAQTTNCMAKERSRSTTEGRSCDVSDCHASTFACNEKLGTDNDGHMGRTPRRRVAQFSAVRGSSSSNPHRERSSVAGIHEISSPRSAPLQSEITDSGNTGMGIPSCRSGIGGGRKEGSTTDHTSVDNSSPCGGRDPAPDSGHQITRDRREGRRSEDNVSIRESGEVQGALFCNDDVSEGLRTTIERSSEPSRVPTTVPVSKSEGDVTENIGAISEEGQSEPRTTVVAQGCIDRNGEGRHAGGNVVDLQQPLITEDSSSLPRLGTRRHNSALSGGGGPSSTPAEPKFWSALGTRAPSSLDVQAGFGRHEIKGEWVKLPLHAKDVKTIDITRLDELPARKEEREAWRKARIWIEETAPYELAIQMRDKTKPRRRTATRIHNGDIKTMLTLHKWESVDDLKDDWSGCIVLCVPEKLETLQRRRRVIVEPLLNDLLHKWASVWEVLEKVKLKFPSRDELRSQILEGGYAIHLDFSAWYDQIPLAELVRHYFTVRTRRKYLQLTRLPMGFRQSVEVACAITALIMSFETTSVTTQYIDNVRFLGTRDQVIKDATTFITRCRSIGATLNEFSADRDLSEVDQLVVREADFLGEHIDYDNKKVSLPEKSVSKLSSCWERVGKQITEEESSHNGPLPTWRQFAVVIGLLFYHADTLAIRFAEYFELQRFVSEMGTILSGDQTLWDKAMKRPSDKVKDQISEVVATICKNEPVPIIPHNDNTPIINMYTDASAGGWGAWIQRNHEWTPASGTWEGHKHRESMGSSVVAEPAGIVEALKYLDPKGEVNIQIWTDHQPFIYGGMAGYAKNYLANEALREIYRLWPKANITLHHIPGDRNPSDGLSRGTTQLMPSKGILQRGLLLPTAVRGRLATVGHHRQRT